MGTTKKSKGESAAATSSKTIVDHVVHVVQPNFNTAGFKESLQALTAAVNLGIFDKATQSVLKSGKTFTLVLGQGFDTTSQVEAMAIQPANCAGLSSIEQLRFLQKAGLTQIVMGRNRPTLVQNARALGIDVIVGG